VSYFQYDEDFDPPDSRSDRHVERWAVADFAHPKANTFFAATKGMTSVTRARKRPFEAALVAP
jgi:hypothetical protein